MAKNQTIIPAIPNTGLGRELMISWLFDEWVENVVVFGARPDFLATVQSGPLGGLGSDLRVAGASGSGKLERMASPRPSLAIVVLTGCCGRGNEAWARGFIDDDDRPTLVNETPLVRVSHEVCAVTTGLPALIR